MKIKKTMEIYFDDLNQDAQQEYIEVIGVKTLDEIDMTIPISIIDIDENNTNRNEDTFFDLMSPANIGKFYGGGYIAGIIDSARTQEAFGEKYILIVSPRILGESANLKWGGYKYIFGAQSSWDGKQNTIDLMSDSIIHPAAAFCNDLTINGYSDWYLPAPDELELIYFNFKPTIYNNYIQIAPLYDLTNGLNPNSKPNRYGYTINNPSQTRLFDWQDGGSEALTKTEYWSSMKYNDNKAFSQCFSDGKQSNKDKDHLSMVRAVRRVLIDLPPKIYYW